MLLNGRVGQTEIRLVALAIRGNDFNTCSFGNGESLSLGEFSIAVVVELDAIEKPDLFGRQFNM